MDGAGYAFAHIMFGIMYRVAQVVEKPAPVRLASALTLGFQDFLVTLKPKASSRAWISAWAFLSPLGRDILGNNLGLAQLCLGRVDRVLGGLDGPCGGVPLSRGFAEPF